MISDLATVRMQLSHESSQMGHCGPSHLPFFCDRNLKGSAQMRADHAAQATPIGFVAFDGVTVLDLIGPHEVFGTANALAGKPLYAPVIVGSTLSPIVSDTGVVLQPSADFGEPVRFDTIVTPGGPGLREPSTNERVSAWLAQQAPQTRRMVSVCTGLYGLAATGLLDGRQVATHWRWARDAARRFPTVSIDASVLFVADPPFYTSAGVTAGIDLALALVEQDHGPELALDIARELVIYLKRPGGQPQFSEPLQFQSSAVNRFSELAAWLPQNLQEDLSVDALAARVNMGARHFSRVFSETFGSTPGRFVEMLRLDIARERLGASKRTVDAVASSVGFASPDVFRRAFERRFGVSPTTYRRHFALSAAASGNAHSQACIEGAESFSERRDSP
jgi:transcriptional regulator GlxA family with amidase domain